MDRSYGSQFQKGPPEFFTSTSKAWMTGEYLRLCRAALMSDDLVVGRKGMETVGGL